MSLQKPATTPTPEPLCVTCGLPTAGGFRAWDIAPLCAGCFLDWERAPEVKAVSKLDYRADTAAAYRVATSAWFERRRGVA